MLNLLLSPLHECTRAPRCEMGGWDAPVQFRGTKRSEVSYPGTEQREEEGGWGRVARRHLLKSIRGRGMTRDTKGETDTREETASLVSAVWVSRLLVT